ELRRRAGGWGVRASEANQRSATSQAWDGDAPFAFDSPGHPSLGLGWAPDHTRPGGLDEALYKSERGLGDLAPAAVDDERVPAVGHLDDLGHRLVALLLFV